MVECPLALQTYGEARRVYNAPRFRESEKKFPRSLFPSGATVRRCAVLLLSILLATQVAPLHPQAHERRGPAPSRVKSGILQANRSPRWWYFRHGEADVHSKEPVKTVDSPLIICTPKARTQNKTERGHEAADRKNGKIRKSRRAAGSCLAQ